MNWLCCCGRTVKKKANSKIRLRDTETGTGTGTATVSGSPGTNSLKSGSTESDGGQPKRRSADNLNQISFFPRGFTQLDIQLLYQDHCPSSNIMLFHAAMECVPNPHRLKESRFCVHANDLFPSREPASTEFQSIVDKEWPKIVSGGNHSKKEGPQGKSAPGDNSIRPEGRSSETHTHSERGRRGGSCGAERELKMSGSRESRTPTPIVDLEFGVFELVQKTEFNRAAKIWRRRTDGELAYVDNTESDSLRESSQQRGSSVSVRSRRSPTPANDLSPPKSRKMRRGNAQSERRSARSRNRHLSKKSSKTKRSQRKPIANDDQKREKQSSSSKREPKKSGSTLSMTKRNNPYKTLSEKFKSLKSNKKKSWHGAMRSGKTEQLRQRNSNGPVAGPVADLVDTQLTSPDVSIVPTQEDTQYGVEREGSFSGIQLSKVKSKRAPKKSTKKQVEVRTAQSPLSMGESQES